jgi:hypothetical protein
MASIAAMLAAAPLSPSQPILACREKTKKESLMLPERTMHKVNEATASWLEAEKGGSGACQEVL